ncbi:MAG: HD domain-containing protein [Deltaproteobacteria bacterium]|nr:MAG: HD domain-containing protein [Deltaproteobacteria bacterium]
MKKNLFVSDLKSLGNALIFSDYFLVTSKSVLRTNAGKPYLNITLRDKSGEIEGRVWDNVEELSSRFSAFDFVKVTGSLVNHQGRYQVKVLDIEGVSGDEVDPADYIPSSEKPPEEMWEDLLSLVETLKDEKVKKFVRGVLTDEETREKFLTAPGGKRLHHDYRGGLLEHTLSVARICDFLSSHYEGVDRDMLLAGAILHDLGKTREILSGPSFEYTDEGKLLGHITLGASLLTAFQEREGILPPKRFTELLHIVISHHGELEYGSPKRPKTLEAVIVHFVENLDSKVNAFLSVLKEADEGAVWSDYQRMFSRFLYLRRGEGE